MNELKDHLISCFDLKYITDSLEIEEENLIEDAKVTLNGFINFIRNRIEEGK